LEIERSIDIEDEVRAALDDYVNAYCRPLPEDFALPCVLVTQVGGTNENKIDTFEVMLDCRAKIEADALELLRNSIGILKKVAREQSTAIRYVTVNSSGSWGNDPVRPELSLCTARLRIVAHIEKATIQEKSQED